MNDLLDLMNNNKGEVNFELIATIFVFLMGWSFPLIRRNVVLRYIYWKYLFKGANVKTYMQMLDKSVPDRNVNSCPIYKVNVNKLKNKAYSNKEDCIEGNNFKAFL